MKTGQTIDQVLQTIKEQAARERDFIAPQKMIEFTADYSEHRLKMHMLGDPSYLVPNGVFLGQAQELAGIPKKYFDRCLLDDPALAARNLNHWFEKSPDNRLVRTFLPTDDGLSTARALLSPSFDRTWGHAPMAAALQMAIRDLQDVDFVSCEITDKKLYIKAVLPNLIGTIDAKDASLRSPFEVGFIMGNSEVGFGRWFLNLFVRVKICNNGMCIDDFGSISKVHRGRKELTVGELQVKYESDTIQAKRVAMVGELRDAIKTLCTFETVAQVEKIINGVASTELANPMGAIQQLAASYELNDLETKAVEHAFLKGGDISRWGLVQALTAASVTVPTYDRATELEALGGKLINLPATEWQVLDKAA